MELAKYVNENAVLLSPKGKSKEELLEEMVRAACAASAELNFADLLARVKERERVRSTGFGKGLAVAHARLERCPELKAVLARPTEPIEWDAADSLPVRFVVLVIGAESQEALYLQILSEITKVWARQATRALLLSAETADEVLRIILEARPRKHPR